MNEKNKTKSNLLNENKTINDENLDKIDDHIKIMEVSDKGEELEWEKKKQNSEVFNANTLLMYDTLKKNSDVYGNLLE